MEGDERYKDENVSSIGHHINKIEVFLLAFLPNHDF
jgi:hypothetical protein